MVGREHWDAVYRRKPADAMSWYQPHLARSLEFIEAAGLPSTAAILDVGGGASTLVDDLLTRGYTNVAVLDLAESALDVARARLGPRASAVRWLVGDVRELALAPASLDFWHDRAVFHFLTDADSRALYVTAARRALKPGGHIVVATFGERGPEQCSGLPVCRYGADALHAVFGGDFIKVASASEAHTTPWGTQQDFVYCFCRLGG